MRMWCSPKQKQKGNSGNNNNGHIHFLCVYLNSFTAHCIIYLARLDFCHSINKKRTSHLALACSTLARYWAIIICEFAVVLWCDVWACARARFCPLANTSKSFGLIYARARYLCNCIRYAFFRFFSSFANLCLHTIIALVFILFAYAVCAIEHRRPRRPYGISSVLCGLLFLRILNPCEGKWMRCRQWIAIAHITAAAFSLFLLLLLRCPSFSRLFLLCKHVNCNWHSYS